MKIKVPLILLLILLSGRLMAQDEESDETKGFDRSKLFFGGTFGVSFGDYTFANISPQIGYRFNRFLAAGTGVNFIFSSAKYRDYNNNPDYKAEYGVAGLNIFGRFYPIEQAFLQLQPEMNYTWGKYKFYNTGQPDIQLDKQFVPSLLLGGGAAIPAGRGAFIAMLQYDLIQTDRSPYGKKAFFSFGYNVGF